MKRVVCVGSAVIDVLVKSNDFKVMKSHQIAGGVAMCEVYGGKTEADEISLETGGSGTNVAVGLARLGIASATLAAVGDDWMKEQIINALTLEGVESSLVQVERGVKTGMSVILVAADGGRSIITYRGASKGLVGVKIDWEKVARADWIQIGALGGNLSLVEDLVSYARERKIRVGWNPGKGELAHKEGVMRLLPKVELLLLNRMEASGFLRHPYEEMKEMAEKLIQFGVKMVSITDGKKGAGVACGGVWLTSPAFKTKSIDDTGAGDAFTAGLVAGRLAEKDLAVSLQMGLANGANKVTELGAKRGLLRKREMSKWLRRRVKMVEEKMF